MSTQAATENGQKSKYRTVKKKASGRPYGYVLKGINWL